MIDTPSTLNTNLGALIQSSMPSFAHERLERFSEFELRPRIAERKYQQCATVNLSLVVGTEHPDYHGRSWLELLGNPPGRPAGQLKRIHGGLLDLAHNPVYYLTSNEKNQWSFYLVHGRYYISTGMHRTVIARFLLACNRLPTIVSGVAVTELVLREPNPLKEGLFRLFRRQRSSHGSQTKPTVLAERAATLMRLARTRGRADGRYS